MPEKLADVPGRKRKQSPSSMQEPSSSSTSAYQQSTITDHFTSRSQSPAVLPSQPSQPKRSKANSADSSFKENMTPVTEATMFNFGTQQVPVDLTSSPASSSKSHPSSPIPSNNAKPSTPSKTLPLQRNSGARRLQVRNFRKSTKNNADGYFNTMRESLSTALTAIFDRKNIPMSLEELYRGVENICKAGKAPELFELLKTHCSDYVLDQLKPNIMQDIGEDVIHVARVVDMAWTQWEKQLSTIRSIFLYLDRSYLFSSPTRKSIEATSVSLFRIYIVESPELESKLLKGVFALFEQDRQSGGEESINSALLMSFIRMISNLGLYSSRFEPRFIEASREYYTLLAKRESQAHGLTTYIKECADQIEKEAVRCDKFHLEMSTKRELLAVLEEEMVRRKVPLLTDKKRVRGLLERGDSDSLQILYELLERVTDAGESLKPAWEAYIIEEGSKIATDKEKEVDMVQRLLDFKGTLNYIWTGPLKKNATIGFSLRESFSSFINERREGASMKDNSKPAEMIAKYVDLLLRFGAKGLPPVAGAEANFESTNDDDAVLAYRLELVIDLFRFIQGKDVFEAFYKKDLARRLLLGRSASVDAERLMLTKLKTECGAGFTNNLEAMFKDMDLSKESVISFNTSKRGMEKAQNVDLHVNILSQAAWPSYPDVQVTLPPRLAEHLEAFAEFYVAKHQGRKLTWRHALSHCVLKASFPKGNKDLLLSAFQAVVLLAFNDVGSTGILTYSHLKAASGLTDVELKRTLQSLACGKIRVLVKSPKGRDINETDKFQVNYVFTSPHIRVKINQIQLKETKEENKETHERVEKDRQYETQAAIIRIMKSRQTIRHVELVQQTIEQTKNRGTLDVGLIKQNIEKLIEKDYMERGVGDTYVYVA
ncbi:Cullin family-domain-containing protein [Trichophaea hybrida]|nr:Cullin family-domain-containing protein [Trichophaea hybrida]